MTNDIGEAWAPLVLDVGQRARAEGTVLRLGGGFCLLADGGTILTSNDAAVAASPVIGLRMAAPLADLEQFEGRTVVAQGSLEDGQLAVDDVVLAPVSCSATRVPAEPSQSFSAIARRPERQGPPDVVERRRDEETFQEVESVLMGDDLLMSFGRGTSPDGQMTVTAVLLHLPARLARRLSQFPPAILDVQVLARPA